MSNDEDDPENGNHYKFLVKAEEGVNVLLNDIKCCKAFLEKAIEAVEMRELDCARMYNVPLEIMKMGLVPYQDEGGVTGTNFAVKIIPKICGDIILSTSHVSIHTWPLVGRAVIDLYSCRVFDPDIIIKILDNIFDAEEVQYTDLSQSLIWK
jgi:S-adenosylmethionine/arginine decarboxylase-like enzyme